MNDPRPDPDVDYDPPEDLVNPTAARAPAAVEPLEASPEVEEDVGEPTPEELREDLEVREGLSAPAPLPSPGPELPPPPPQDLEAEAAVLGSLLLDPEAIFPVLQVLRAEDFYRESHRRIFTALAALHEGTGAVDTLLLREELRRRGDLDIVGGPEVLVGLLDRTPTAAHALRYAGIVAEMAGRRALLLEGLRLQEAARNGVPLAEAVDSSRAVLDGVARRAADGDAGDDACNVYSLPDLLRAEVEEPDPLLGSHVLDRGGLAMLVSEEGAGKTHLALDLAVSWARGDGQFLGLSVLPRPVRTLFLWGEGGLFGARDRLRTLVGDGEAPAALRIVVPKNISPDLATAEGAARVQRYAEDHKAEVLVVDTLSEFSSHDENDATSAKLLLRRINGIRRSLGVAVVVSHHTRKAGDASVRGSAREARGSTVLPGAADAVLSLNREPDGRLLASWAKLRACPPLPALLLQFNAEAGRFVIVGEKAPAARAQSVRERILEALRAAGTWQTYDALERTVKKGRRTIERWIVPLVEEGLVEKVGGAPAPVMFRLAVEAPE